MDAGKNFTINTMVRANETVKSLNGIGVSQEDVVKFLTRTENVNKKGFLDILLHTHFLGQHSIRDFIYGNRLDDDDKITSNRYNLLAEMFGFGEIEQIKRRLTGVLTHIKRSKVNGAAHNIEAIKTQIRGLQHKYGIKNRHDLEKKGYQITTENAVERYYAIVGRVGAAIGASFIRQLLVPANSPMETYQASCESVITLINKELKSLESRASDIKRLGRIVARINMIFPDVAASNTISIREFLGDIRQRVSKSIEVTEQNERKLQAIDREIEVHDSNIKNLRQFIQGYDQYSELLALERNEIESLARIQKVKNELLQKQSHLLVRSQHAAGEEQTEKRFLIEMEGRARKYGDLLASLDQIKAAEIILQQEVQRQYVIEEAIGQYREKLKRLDEQTTKPDCDGALQSPNLDLDLFRMDDYYKCPCCGTKFEDKHEFEKSLHGQLSIGRFRKELLAFFTELERRNVETLKAHIRQTIFEYTQERTNLERSSRTKSRAIEAFYGLASELGESKQISEKVLRDAFDKYNSIVRTTRQSIDSHEAKALRVALSKLATELNDLKDDDHKKQLSIVQDNIIKKTRTLKGVISSDEIQDLTKIQARLEGLSTELYELNCRRDHISNEIRVGGLDEKSQKTVDESVSELESLLLKQDAFRIYPLNSTTNLEKENIDRQKMCYELLAEMNELIKLMGCLTAQERSETLKNQLNRYEKEKNRWELCYQSIERLNNELSKLSSSGLHESLAQYGPLVNQIYQKFIRHDIFSALILKAKASPKARKRDLYLRLKSYSGDAKYTPASYLSEAQLNILALSIFLTRVMYQNISALETVFIDDPIQQMDDMNTAAFVDIVLGLSTVGKQIIITTCNHDFYRLVAHKMHSLATGGRITFKAIDLDSGQE